MFVKIQIQKSSQLCFENLLNYILKIFKIEKKILF